MNKQQTMAGLIIGLIGLSPIAWAGNAACAHGILNSEREVIELRRQVNHLTAAQARAAPAPVPAHLRNDPVAALTWERDSLRMQLAAARSQLALIEANKHATIDDLRLNYVDRAQVTDIKRELGLRTQQYNELYEAVDARLGARK